jgi:hypothetical protein
MFLQRQKVLHHIALVTAMRRLCGGTALFLLPWHLNSRMLRCSFVTTRLIGYWTQKVWYWIESIILKHISVLFGNKLELCIDIDAQCVNRPARVFISMKVATLFGTQRLPGPWKITVMCVHSNYLDVVAVNWVRSDYRNALKQSMGWRKCDLEKQEVCLKYFIDNASPFSFEYFPQTCRHITAPLNVLYSSSGTTQRPRLSYQTVLACKVTSFLRKRRHIILRIWLVSVYLSWLGVSGYLSLGLKRPECETDSSHHFSVEVENGWFTFTAPVFLGSDVRNTADFSVSKYLNKRRLTQYVHKADWLVSVS